MNERDLWQLGDEELLAVLRESQVRLSRAYGEQLTLLGELLARNLTPGLGYRSTGRLLQDLLRIGRADATRRLAHAAAVTAAPAISGSVVPPALPATAEAVRAGVLGAEQLEAVHRVITRLPAETHAKDVDHAERALVDAARTVGPAALAKLGRAIHARLDQDGRPPTGGSLASPVNELHLVRRGDGGLAFRGRLATEEAALLTTVLSPLAKPRPAVQGEPDLRSRAERYGDALAEALRLVAKSGALPADGGERPTLIVTMTLDSLRAKQPDLPRQNGSGSSTASPANGAGRQLALLGDGTFVDARTARRLACDGAVIPAVLSSRSEPLDIGRKTRVVPVAMRRALALRDGGCAFPDCTVPASWCDAHHLRHWADGGVTALRNLVLLCGTHHDLIHDSGWQVQLPDGIPEFVPPAYIDPSRRPRRNPVHLRAP